ncbi:MAG: histidine--tRNA ligase [Candidatus Liptonbacteria bacterium]|nr:histidine--tRNA ligase [Candidatus Liptonbacteria bacterium]
MTTKKDKPKKEAVVRMFQAPKGMRDALPADQPYWERIESVIKDAARSYNFHRIDPPVLESADLFRRTVGEETDLVEKEMYTLRTKGGDLLALRPEFTASIMRAYLEHNLSRTGQPQKLYHYGPVFRHDRPQLGRTRQFTQTGFDIIGGVNDAVYDAKILMMCMGVLDGLKIKNTVLKINSIGCKVCRPIYKKQLQNYYKNREKDLCAECVKRLKTNPLRLLDCKDPQCEKLKTKAPNFLDKICATCSKHFKQVLEYLDELQISYVLDNQLVRGLDYYDRTVFEIFAEGAGSEVGAIFAGGRYDYLMEYIGGRLTPAVGGSFGAERLIAVMKARELIAAPRTTRRVFVAHAGDSAKKKAVGLIKELVDAGIPVSEALAKDSLRAQLKSADKEGVGIALILGQKEIYEASVIIRDMRTGLQDSVKMERIIEEIKKRSRG